MKVVVDTNCIISAMIRDGISRRIITHSQTDLLAVDFSREEIEEHRSEITNKAKISDIEFDLVLGKLFQNLTILDMQIIKAHLKEAEDIMGNIDKDDVIFISAALATKSDIWSDDAHFKKQNKIKVLTTKELIKKLDF